jgi:hypothetical protein
MMIIVAIDPGTTESAFVVWDGKKIHTKGIVDNEFLLEDLKTATIPNVLVIEQIKSYGMAVGASVFETVFWTGRFCEAFRGDFYRMGRLDVKMHLCHSARAKDANVTQALIDRFAPNEPNRGKGTKKAPGFFYEFKSDIWQAFALAVAWWDINKEGSE